MKLHANAALGPKGRLVMVGRVVEEDWSLAAAAGAAGVSERTCGKWVARYRAEGYAGLVDRSSAPRRVPSRTPEDRRQVIAALRRIRMTASEIAELLDMALSTVSGLLKEMGMGKLGRLGLEPAERYERARPGELIHIDVKKLGRIARPGHAMLGQSARATKGYHRKAHHLGWEFVHVAIDDCTRLGYVEVLADEKATTAIAFCAAPPGFTAAAASPSSACSPTTARPTAPPCTPSPAAPWASATYAPVPTAPKPNGKAERFIRTLLAGWAYGALYRTSTERTAALDAWLDYYNHQRRHSALGHKPPIARLNEHNNLLGTYS